MLSKRKLMNYLNLTMKHQEVHQEVHQKVHQGERQYLVLEFGNDIFIIK
jgi:hypothetical protein